MLRQLLKGALIVILSVGIYQLIKWYKADVNLVLTVDNE